MMNKRRIKVPDEVAAEVLFRSDRTCCICRDPARKVQIHHVDQVPANNEINNLAVLCTDCHIDAHTSHAFARKLSPILIQKHSENWQEIVRIRRDPGDADVDAIEYTLQILLELSLEPHRWVNLNLCDPNLYSIEARGSDRWAYLMTRVEHDYSEAAWKHYKPLFEKTPPLIANHLEHTLRTYGDAVQPRTKLQVFRTASSLRNGRLAYLSMPMIVEADPDQFGFSGDLGFTIDIGASDILMTCTGGFCNTNPDLGPAH